MSLNFPMTRWSLVGRLGATPEATSILLELYFDSIARYLRQRFPEEVRTGDLDDVIQEVFVHVLDHPSVLSTAKPGIGSRFRYVLMTVAFNAARNALRTRRRRRSKDARVIVGPDGDDIALSDGVIDDATEHADVAMDRAWAQSVLEQAWNDLRAWSDQGLLESDCVSILEDSVMRGMSVRDAASARGLSPATCQRRLARGRTFLQRAIVDRLTQAGEVPSDADPARAYTVLLDLLRRA